MNAIGSDFQPFALVIKRKDNMKINEFEKVEKCYNIEMTEEELNNFSNMIYKIFVCSAEILTGLNKKGSKKEERLEKILIQLQNFHGIWFNLIRKLDKKGE